MSDYIDFSRIDGIYSDKQRRVNEVIADIFPSVRVVKLPEEHPAFSQERPFALVDQPEFGMPYVIRSLYESEIDHRLVAELVRNNLRDSNSEVNKLQLLEMSEQLLEAKREQEYFEERKDILKSALASKKNTWTHEGKTLRK